MGSAAVRGSHHVRWSRAFAWLSFLIMLAGWLAFLAALIGSRQSLDDIWTAVRDLPLVLEGVVWLLGFPFLAGLLIWQAGWDETARLIAIAVLAAGYTFMFLPRDRTRRPAAP